LGAPLTQASNIFNRAIRWIKSMSSPKHQFCQCTNPECRLRFPLDPSIHSGQYCPLCGAPMQIAAKVYASTPPPAQFTEKPIQVAALLDNIRSALNVGSAFRIADGAGLTHLYLCGITPTPADNESIAKTSLGAELAIPWSQHRNALDLALSLKELGALLIALESTPNAHSIYDFHPHTSLTQLVVLMIGSETAGVDPGLLEVCDHVLNIPMRGKKESLNAAVAFGIAAYFLTRP